MDMLPRFRRRSPKSRLTLGGSLKDVLHEQLQSNHSAQKLCKRCRDLRLASQIEQPWTTVGYDRAAGCLIDTIDDGTIDKACDLCKLWSGLMGRASTSLGDTRHSQRCFQLWSCRARHGCWTGTYFYVHFTEPDLRLFLFPTQESSECLSTSWAGGPPRGLSHEAVPHRDLGTTPGMLKFEIAKGWIENCRSQHTACSAGLSLDPCVPTRLIDCQNRQLCTGTSQQYVCLSYTWGSGSKSASTLHGTLPVDLPQVVFDAMEVVLQLEMRYLWVDRYCINQDDAEEKHDIIQNMGTICESKYRSWNADFQFLLPMLHIL